MRHTVRPPNFETDLEALVTMGRDFYRWARSEERGLKWSDEDFIRAMAWYAGEDFMRVAVNRDGLVVGGIAAVRVVWPCAVECVSVQEVWLWAYENSGPLLVQAMVDWAKEEGAVNVGITRHNTGDPRKDLAMDRLIRRWGFEEVETCYFMALA